MGIHVIIDDVIMTTHAAAGELVPIQINLKNVSSATIVMQPEALAGLDPIYFNEPGWTFAPGITAGWSTFFMMPTNAIDVIAYGYYKNPQTNLYELEDTKTYHVTLDSEEQYAGAFVSKTLEVYSTPYNIPAQNVALGSTCRLKVTIRSDMSTYKTMITSWVVLDPNNQIVQAPSDTAPVTPGGTRDIIGPNFYPSVAGSYTIQLSLSVDGLPLDNYNGVLCVVAGGVPDGDGNGDFDILEIDITPIGRGYVVTDVAAVDGRTEWHADDLGQFPTGTLVQVTAYPYVGYEFEKWSDEIEGDVSYQNPAYVKPMTENRTVKLHLREVSDGGGITGVVINSLTIDGWGSSPSSLGVSPVEIGAGGTLYVGFTLNYDAVEEGPVELWASLVIDPGRDRTWKFSVPLLAGTGIIFTDVLAIPIPSTESTLSNDTYDLWLEINNVIDDKAMGAVTLTGMPAGILGGLGNIGELIMMMMVMMMMTMMMEQTRDIYEPAGTPPRPKPVTEAVVEGAKGAVKYGGKAIKKATEYYTRGKGD